MLLDYSSNVAVLLQFYTHGRAQKHGNNAAILLPYYTHRRAQKHSNNAAIVLPYYITEEPRDTGYPGGLKVIQEGSHKQAQKHVYMQ